MSLDCPAPGPIALADTIHVTLAVEGSPALVVDAPGEMPAGSAWLLVERRPCDPPTDWARSTRERWRRFQFFFALRVNRARKLPFIFPDVKFKDGQEEQSISFAPAYYEITTQIKDADLSQLKGIPNIEPLPLGATRPIIRWPLWAIVAGAEPALFAAVCGIMLVLVLRRLLGAAWNRVCPHICCPGMASSRCAEIAGEGQERTLHHVADNAGAPLS